MFDSGKIQLVSWNTLCINDIIKINEYKWMSWGFQTEHSDFISLCKTWDRLPWFLKDNVPEFLMCFYIDQRETKSKKWNKFQNQKDQNF